MAPVSAQQPGDVFVQMEAHPNLREARERAQAYGSILPNINGFALGGGWYGLALGPYGEAGARAELRRLLREGLVPRDSYVTRGETYRQRFWPAGLQDTAPPVQAPVLAAPQADEIVPPAPVGQPEETARQARLSESRLNREEKKELQRALQWFGHYDAAIDGSYGRGTRNAMASWQAAVGVDVTGILTTRQRARLLQDWVTAQGRLGLARLEVPEAGIALTAPVGLVEFDRIEAPFVHYAPRDGSGVRMALISQPGDRATLGGLYEILQALEIVPPDGPRGKERDGFRIRGEEPGRRSEVFARLTDGHIVGYLLSWPEAEADAATRALEQMEATLASVGAPLDPEEGFDPAQQSLDMVSGLEVRRPLRSASGFFVDRSGAVLTAAETVQGCGRVTLDRLHDADVAFERDGVAVLRPRGPLAPVEVASLSPNEGRLRSAVSVGGFPFGGVLGAATLSFGTLEDVRGLNGEETAFRLSLEARDGDVGGPVLDVSGRVSGMLLPDPVDGTRVLPSDVALAKKSSALLPILSEAGIDAAVTEISAPIAPEDLTVRAAGLTVLVSCWE
ncbi:MAG: serine protease [Pseudomonadota bacterium]